MSDANNSLISSYRVLLGTEKEQHQNEVAIQFSSFCQPMFNLAGCKVKKDICKTKHDITRALLDINTNTSGNETIVIVGNDSFFNQVLKEIYLSPNAKEWQSQRIGFIPIGCKSLLKIDMLSDVDEKRKKFEKVQALSAAQHIITKKEPKRFVLKSVEIDDEKDKFFTLNQPVTGYEAEKNKIINDTIFLKYIRCTLKLKLKSIFGYDNETHSSNSGRIDTDLRNNLVQIGNDFLRPEKISINQLNFSLNLVC